MAYRIRKKDASVEAAVRRIAGEQIGKSVAFIDEADSAEAVHDVRKRCKKLRALVRLVRPALPAYAEENAEFRDISRLISSARDAKVMQDTYDLLATHYGSRINRRALGSIRRRFTLQLKSEAGGEEAAHGLAECRSRLLEAKARVPGWTLAEPGFAPVAGGLTKTYKRARKAADEAFANPTPEAVHELRKRLKYHWYHSWLISNIWPDLLHVHASLAKELTELLGVHHDLSVFEEHLARDPGAYGSRESVATATNLARRYREKIEHRAEPMVRRLLAQEPEEMIHEWQALWLAWQEAG